MKLSVIIHAHHAELLNISGCAELNIGIDPAGEDVFEPEPGWETDEDGGGEEAGSDDEHE